MRIFRAAVIAIMAATAVAGCGSGGGLFQQYEYEEDVYLSLDGAATVYVNSSIPALNALRGASFNPDPQARVDREALRQYYTTPVTRVASITDSRRSGRRFVHVRLDVDDIRRLGESAPFAWSRYDLRRTDSQYLFTQAIGAAAGRPASGPGWDGREVVVFRLHLPSKIDYHNAGAANLRGGNILVWEQKLTDRMNGVPLLLDARMQTQSILYTTLSLFGITCVAVALMFGIVVVVVRRSGTRGAGEAGGLGGAGGAG
jgi:hypothetical protein